VGARSAFFQSRRRMFRAGQSLPPRRRPAVPREDWSARPLRRAGSLRFDARAGIFALPWHGWEYDIRTGQSWCDPKSVRARQCPGDGRTPARASSKGLTSQRHFRFRSRRTIWSSMWRRRQNPECEHLTHNLPLKTKMRFSNSCSPTTRTRLKFPTQAWYPHHCALWLHKAQHRGERTGTEPKLI
jgi:hypothetical protein